MTYLLIIIILAVAYYTITYGIYVWKNEKNILGGFAVICLTALSTIGSIIFIIIRT